MPMRILLLTQVVPYPPDSGPKIKTYNVLRYLSRQGHRVTLVSFVRDGEKEYLKYLSPYCEQIQTIPLRRSHVADVGFLLQSVAKRTPFLIQRDHSRRMAALVHSLLNRGTAPADRYDIVHIVRANMAQYAEPGRSRFVLDTENSEWTIWHRLCMLERNPLKRMLMRIEYRKLRSYEGRVCQQVDAVIAVSEIDRRALIDAGGNPSKIKTMPIAVDCAQLHPIKTACSSQEILSASTLFYPPNADGVRWFMHEVYPLVRSKVPTSSLKIVGPRPPRDIKHFALRHAGITVTGYVPDLKPYLERASVMVVPVRAASGMRVRILEALARGVPVVTTTTGLEGIDAVDGKHILVADEPGSFAEAVISLLKNPELGERLARNGRALVEQKYDWPVVLPKLDEVYNAPNCE